ERLRFVRAVLGRHDDLRLEPAGWDDLGEGQGRDFSTAIDLFRKLFNEPDRNVLEWVVSSDGLAFFGPSVQGGWRSPIDEPLPFIHEHDDVRFVIATSLLAAQGATNHLGHQNRAGGLACEEDGPDAWYIDPFGQHSDV